MPEITRDQVEHLARLAHIRMTDEELDTMSGDLEKILEHVSAVQAAAGDDVPTALVMHEAGCTREAAAAALRQTHGVVREAVRFITTDEHR